MRSYFLMPVLLCALGATPALSLSNEPYLAAGKHNYVLRATTEAIARTAWFLRVIGTESQASPVVAQIAQPV